MTIRALLVDDHKEVLEKLRIILSQEPGFEIVTTATDGEEALKILKRFPVDVVVMDFNLPGINGVEAAKKILADRPEIKIVIISMHADPRYVKESFKAGITGYLLKDNAFEEMVAAIHTVLEKGTYVSPCIEIGLLQ